METIKAMSHFVRIMRNPITLNETTKDMNTPLGGQATAFLVADILGNDWVISSVTQR